MKPSAALNTLTASIQGGRAIGVSLLARSSSRMGAGGAPISTELKGGLFAKAGSLLIKKVGRKTQSPSDWERESVNIVYTVLGEK